MPYTGVVLAILAAHAAAFLILLGHWTVALGMFPRSVTTFAATYERRPVRAALVGLFTFGPLLVLFVRNASIHYGPLRFLVVAVAVLALLGALFGTAGLALRIGRNLSQSAEPWQQALRGGVMLSLVFITPILGWFLVLPLGLASGFGAFLLSRPWQKACHAEPEGIPPIPVAAPAIS